MLDLVQKLRVGVCEKALKVILSSEKCALFNICPQGLRDMASGFPQILEYFETDLYLFESHVVNFIQIKD